MPKILDNGMVYHATMKVIIEKGYARATTKLIAKVAGISEVTVFRKFGNKAQLVKQAIDSIAAQIDFGSAVRYTGDVKADLLRVVRRYQGSAEKNGQFFYTILLEIPRYPELRELLDTPLTMFHSFGQLLARYQAEGSLKQEHPLHAVVSLIGPLAIANMLRYNKADAPFPPLDLPNHVSQFLNGRFVSY
jgi:AcrR family transcriptional regulator